MKCVILAGGYGTRISEESMFRPKPMVEIGGVPILIHIMKIYHHFGVREFVICAGYKQEYIKRFFNEYFLYNSDVTFDFSDGNEMRVNSSRVDPWKVTVADTGLNTMTGGRVKRIRRYVDGEDFFLTYGDGVADIDISELLKQHKKNGKIVTLSAYNPGQRFGVLDVDKAGVVRSFREKTSRDGGLVNIGFMVCKPTVFEFIQDDNTIFEQEPLQTLAKHGELGAYIHNGFWQCMDTVREKQKLEKLWSEGNAPWSFR